MRRNFLASQIDRRSSCTQRQQFPSFSRTIVSLFSRANSSRFKDRLKMSRVAEDIVNHLFAFPETMEKLLFHSHPNQEANENKGVTSIPVDILDSPREYIFYMDVPGLSKSDIQVTIEDDKTLVIRSNAKRKREDGEEEGCKYIRLERRVPRKLLRKFRLPENANVSTIIAKCENGVLTLVVDKHPPPPKSKTVEVTIS